MRRFSQSVRYALAGLRIAWREEFSFQIQVVCALVVVALGFAVRLSTTKFLFLVLAIGIVLTAEIFNTALEELCDKFQPTHDPHIAKIKDLAAAAVLVSSCAALGIGLILFIPYL